MSATATPEVILASDTIQLPARISEIDKAIKRLKREYLDVPDVTNKQGLALAKSRKAELVALRVDGDKARLAFTKPIREQLERVNAAWNDEILPEIKALEDPLAKAIKEERERSSEARRLAAEAEEARKDAIRARLVQMQSAPATLATLEDIIAFEATLDAVNAKEYEEFELAALVAIQSTRELLANRKQQVEHQALEAIRQAAEREELERIASEQQAQSERLAAEQAQAAEQLAQERRDFESEKQIAADRAKAVEDRRVAAINDRMLEIINFSEKVKTIEDIPGARARLKAIESDLSVFDERAGQAKREIAHIAAWLKGLRKEMIEEAEFEAKMAKIETARLEALRPEKEKILEWINALPDTLPEVQSDEGQHAIKQIINEIDLMRDFVDKMGSWTPQEV